MMLCLRSLNILHGFKDTGVGRTKYLESMKEKGMVELKVLILRYHYSWATKSLATSKEELTGFEIDLYGSGEGSEQVQEAAKELNLIVRVLPDREHAETSD